MSLFDWLLPRSKPLDASAASPLVGQAPTHLISARPPVVDTDLKARRQERRERLYTVVREAMLRSEVLASRYKFKVLSLDTHGRQFLIMVDLLDASAVSPDRFASIEQLIMGNAAQQHGIYVKSVYWRAMESLTLAALAKSPVAAPAPAPAVAPVAAMPTVASPAVVVKPVSAHVVARNPAFDPIDQAEVLAFKKAIGAIPSTPAAKTPGQVHTSGSRHVLTGFEDTQILDTSDDAASPLSRTQFGELQ